MNNEHVNEVESVVHHHVPQLRLDDYMDLVYIDHHLNPQVG